MKICLAPAYMLIEDPVTGFEPFLLLARLSINPQACRVQIHSQQLSDTLDQFTHQPKPKSVLTPLNQPRFL